MERPCVVVPIDRGEETRTRLADVDLVDRDFDIDAAAGCLYVPVTDPDAVPPDLDVVTHDVAARTPQRTPGDLLGFEPSYERIGDVVVVDEDDPERARALADAVVASDLPVRSVLNRASKVKGELRVRDWEVLANADPDRSPTEAVHREYGHEFHVDLAEVYFSPRLATERHRVVEQVAPGEHAFDMFAGVGPYAIPMADAGAEVVACDLNPVAVEYLRENAARNGIELTALQGDVREVAADWVDWADRVVMNLPHSATDFLDTAVSLAGDDCTLHVYDIQHEDDPFGPAREAVRAAADAYEVEVLTEHVVRSYAPHELNVCLDVRLTR